MKVQISEDGLDRLETIKQSLITDRKAQEEPWKDVSRYINPLLDEWDNDQPPSRRNRSRRMADIYNNEGMKASNKLADGIMSYAFNRGDSWFRLENEDGTKSTNPGGDFLQLAEDWYYRQLSRSNFYDEGRTMVKMCADYGTGIMIREDDKRHGCPVFRALHVKSSYLTQDRFGAADGLMYYSWVPPEEVVREFGKDNVPIAIKTAAENKSTDEVKIWHYVLPFNKYDIDIKGRERRGDREYFSLFIADCDRKKAMRMGTFRIRPFYAWQWSRNLDGSVWGTDSPGLIEISNIMQAQGMGKDWMRGIQLLFRPPIKATKGLEGKIDFTPSGVTYLSQGQDFAPLRTIGDPSALMEGMARIDKSIAESYMTEFFLVLTQNIERMKTATEVEGLQNEQAAMLSAFYGRMINQFLEPSLEDGIENEIISGRLDIPPRMQGKSINIDMISPLAQLQKRKLRLATTDQAMREIIGIAQIKPDVLDNFSLDEYARVIAETYNMNKKIVVDLIDVERIRAARAQAQQEMLDRQMRMEQGKAEADAYSKYAKAPEGGSLAEKVVNK